MNGALYCLFVSIALAGCGSVDPSSGDNTTAPMLPATVPLPECPDADYTTCDIRDSDCQTRMAELAACLRQNEPVRDISVESMTPSDFLALLNAESPADSMPTIQHFDRALSLFGLAPEVATTTSSAPNIDGLLGVYRSKDKRVIVIDRGKPADTADVDATLLHEFIHALQDADYDLLNWPGPDEPRTFDSQLARRSLVEGEASFYEYRAVVPLLGLDITKVDFASAMKEHLAFARAQAAKSETPLDKSFATFPYGFGAELAFAAWTEAGPRGTDPLWASPPTTTQQIMSQVLKLDAPQAAGIDIATPNVPNLVPYADDVLGAWGLDLMLSKQGANDSDAVALAWRGDHFWVFTGNDPSATYVLWQLELANQDDAQAVDAVFGKLWGCDHGTAGARVFANCALKAFPAPELKAWGQSWLAEAAP